MVERLLKKYRYSLILLRELVVTDFKLRYQNSALGYLWALLRPLSLFVILYTIFSIFLGIGKNIPHWPIALLLGIVLWNFFTEVVGGGLKSIVSRGSLLRKLNFPRYIVVISGTIGALINLLLNLVVIAIFMIINRVEPSWTILLVPVVIAELFIFSLGLAFLLAAINVKFRDTQYVWEIVHRGLFYASGVLYPITKISDKSTDAAIALLMNPANQVIQDARYLLVSHDVPNIYSVTDKPLLWLVPIGLSIGTLVVGALYFRRRSPYFAENI